MNNSLKYNMHLDNSTRKMAGECRQGQNVSNQPRLQANIAECSSTAQQKLTNNFVYLLINIQTMIKVKI